MQKYVYMFETIVIYTYIYIYIRYCVSICQKGLVTVVFTEEKKMCLDVLLAAR